MLVQRALHVRQPRSVRRAAQAPPVQPRNGGDHLGVARKAIPRGSRDLHRRCGIRSSWHDPGVRRAHRYVSRAEEADASVACAIVHILQSYFQDAGRLQCHRDRLEGARGRNGHGLLGMRLRVHHGQPYLLEVERHDRTCIRGAADLHHREPSSVCRDRVAPDETDRVHEERRPGGRSARVQSPQGLHATGRARCGIRRLLEEQSEHRCGRSEWSLRGCWRGGEDRPMGSSTRTRADTEGCRCE